MAWLTATVILARRPPLGGHMSSNLVTLRDFCAALCSDPNLLTGRLFHQHGVVYSVTRIDFRTGLARLAGAADGELSLPVEHLVLAELLADAGIFAPSVSVNGAPRSKRRDRVS